MKLYDEIPTRASAEFKTMGDSSALKHAYLTKERINRVSLYKRLVGILFFLQSNTDVFSFKL